MQLIRNRFIFWVLLLIFIFLSLGQNNSPRLKQNSMVYPTQCQVNYEFFAWTCVSRSYAWLGVSAVFFTAIISSPASSNFSTYMCWSALSWILEGGPLKISGILSLSISLLSNILHLNSHCLPDSQRRLLNSEILSGSLLASQLGNSFKAVNWDNHSDFYCCFAFY